MWNTRPTLISQKVRVFFSCALAASIRTYSATLVVCGKVRNCLREHVVGMNFSTPEVHMMTNCRDKKRVRSTKRTVYAALSSVQLGFKILTEKIRFTALATCPDFFVSLCASTSEAAEQRAVHTLRLEHEFQPVSCLVYKKKSWYFMYSTVNYLSCCSIHPAS